MITVGQSPHGVTFDIFIFSAERSLKVLPGNALRYPAAVYTAERQRRPLHQECGE